MAIDTSTETLVTFAQAARRLPCLRGGRPVSPSTLWRWSSRGLRGVRLESARCGGTRVTSTEALSRFFAALDGQQPPSSRREADAQRLDRVEAELLSAHGI